MSNAIAEAAVVAAGEPWIRCSVAPGGRLLRWSHVTTVEAQYTRPPSKPSYNTDIHYDNEINALHTSLYNVFYYIHNF